MTEQKKLELKISPRGAALLEAVASAFLDLMDEACEVVDLTEDSDAMLPAKLAMAVGRLQALTWVAPDRAEIVRWIEYLATGPSATEPSPPSDPPPSGPSVH